MIPELNSHDELKKLLVENQRLLLENNQMLNKLRRTNEAGSLVRIITLLVLVSIPLVIYFVYIKPDLIVINQQLDTFEQMKLDVANYVNVISNQP